MSTNDPFGLAPGKAFEEGEEGEEADEEERETVALTRKTRLRALKMLPDILDMCDGFIKDKALKVRDRLAAAREVRECAGIARVAPPQIYIDQRTAMVSDEEQQLLFELGMADEPQVRRSRPRFVMDTTAELTSPGPGEDLLIERAPVIETPQGGELPPWART